MSHAVTLTWDDGRTETVDAEPDESVVDAAERAGVGIPYACLTGACATCTGRLLDGATAGDNGPLVHHRPPRGLKERHLDDGYVLLCIARPRNDCRVRVGADVQAELVPNPWK